MVIVVVIEVVIVVVVVVNGDSSGDMSGGVGVQPPAGQAPPPGPQGLPAGWKGLQQRDRYNGKACNRKTGYNFMQCISPDITSWTISDTQKSMSEVKVNFLILGVII